MYLVYLVTVSSFYFTDTSTTITNFIERDIDNKDDD